MVVRLEAHSSARALMMRAGTPVMGAAHSGRLGHAVFLAHDVGLELVDAVGVGRQVLLVVGALGEPAVGDGQVEGGVGVGQQRDPLVGVDGVAVVAVGGDVDLLDAQFFPPVAEAADQLAAPAPGSGLGVATPEEQQLGVLGDVVEQVALRQLLADELASPDVLGAPVPAFPASRRCGPGGCSRRTGRAACGRSRGGRAPSCSRRAGRSDRGWRWGRRSPSCGSSRR